MIEVICDVDWKIMDEFVVIFFDCFGKEIGCCGIVLNDSVFLEEILDFLVKVMFVIEDCWFFLYFGIDFVGMFWVMVENVCVGGVV